MSEVGHVIYQPTITYSVCLQYWYIVGCVSRDLWHVTHCRNRIAHCAFASSALYRLATYDSRGSNCSSKAEGDLLKLKLFLECQRNNYVMMKHEDLKLLSRVNLR